MKAKKRLIYAIGLVTVVSIIGAAVSTCLDATFWMNFSFAVFGSSLLGLIMSWVEYFVERRVALEQYYLAAVDVSIAFAKAKYFTMYEPKELLMAYFSERQWESYMDENNTLPAKNELFQYMRRGWGVIVEIPEPEFSQYAQREFDRRIKAYDATLADTIAGYIEIAGTSIQGLENAYGKLDFLLSNHLRARIFDEIHEPIREYRRCIREKTSCFRAFVRSKPEYTAQAIDLVDEIQQKFFRTIIKSDEESDTTIVFQQFVDDLDDQIEWLRCKMYKENYAKQEHTPLLWYQQIKKIHINRGNDIT